jgi:hypothetical protein
LAFDYPADWVLNELGGTSAGDTGFAVAVFDPSGRVLDNEYLDGVMVNVYQLGLDVDASSIADMRSSTEARIESLASSEGWKTLSLFSDVTINGMPGFTVTCSIPSPGGQKLVSPLYFLFDGDLAYYVFPQSAGQPSDDLKHELDSIVNSFAPAD